jgi:hypothetical protein
LNFYQIESLKFAALLTAIGTVVGLLTGYDLLISILGAVTLAAIFFGVEWLSGGFK